MSKARDNASGTLWLPGEIVQTVQVQSTTVRTIAAQDITEIPDLSITFTPKFIGSKILLTANVSTTAIYVSSAGFIKNGSYLASLSPNSNASGSIATYYYGASPANGNIYMNTLQYSDTSTSLSAITYKVGVSSSWAGTVYTIYVNNRDANDMASASSFTIQEIKQ